MQFSSIQPVNQASSGIRNRSVFSFNICNYIPWLRRPLIPNTSVKCNKITISINSQSCQQTEVSERLLKPGWADCSFVPRCLSFYERRAELSFPTSLVSDACGCARRRLHLTLNVVICGEYRTRMSFHLVWPIGFEKRWGLGGVAKSDAIFILSCKDFMDKKKLSGPPGPPQKRNNKKKNNEIDICQKHQHILYFMSIIYFVFSKYMTCIESFAIDVVFKRWNRCHI